ncbi:hypothetical protein [Streptomyces hiroshimensis]|uniref:Uncharacterized protein n=1 Tax=Streptomyces hiroshimensis TaxID=66424 RepID=A0ABQ2YLF9_9ACTN|nr:hypothetical protein [Streptomyces hiroshimensis]GGX86932.1 hypothetical protein GCM10010324_35540 [Streptomyces hiroshimensis]
MATLIARVTDPLLFVDAGRIDLLDQSMADFEPDYSVNGLVDTRPEGAAAAVITATETGDVTVTAELWDGPPQLLADAWQDVAEVQVHWPTGEPMEIGRGNSSLDEEPSLPLPGPGDYRIRVSGRHRDEPEPRDDDAPVEEYLIQVWAAAAGQGGAAGAPVVHKQTSRMGHQYRTGS